MSIADEQYEIPGNAGLKDQTMALKWIQQNGGYFGGDPKNVTLFGLSAGGASAHYHMMSNYSKGLFQKAVALSGTAYAPWAFWSQPTRPAELAEKLGWNGEGGTVEMMRTLRTANANDIRVVQYLTKTRDWQYGSHGAFIPCIEPYDNGNCFLPRDIREMSKIAWGNEIPLLLTATAGDGYSYYKFFSTLPTLFDGYDCFENTIPYELNMPDDCDERRRLGVLIKEMYYGDAIPTIDNLHPYMHLLSIKCFWHGIAGLIRDRTADESTAPTFLYRFSYSSDSLDFYKTASKCTGAMAVTGIF